MIWELLKNYFQQLKNQYGEQQSKVQRSTWTCSDSADLSDSTSNLVLCAGDSSLSSSHESRWLISATRATFSSGQWHARTVTVAKWHTPEWLSIKRPATVTQRCHRAANIMQGRWDKLTFHGWCAVAPLKRSQIWQKEMFFEDFSRPDGNWGRGGWRHL